MNIRSSIYIFLLFTLIAAGMVWHVKVLQTNVVEKSSLAHAKLYSDAIVTFRSLYSSEVVNRAERYGIQVTHDYMDKEQAIPLPATLSILFGQKIGEIGSGASARLYSPYPFPWRKEGGGLRDPFAEEAWSELNKYPDKPFYKFERINGKGVLRYAVADRMRDSCIDCHNSHPDSPINTWKVNDVRGVLDITLPMDAVMASTKTDLQITFALYSILAVLGVTGIVSMITRYGRQASILEDAVQERTLDLEREKINAENANQAKTKFLSRMSHEFRTPLNAILGFSQLLDTNLKRETEKDYCHEIIDAGNHLLDLINEVLDLSRIESGRLDLVMETLSLNDIILAVLRLVKPLAQVKGIELIYDEIEKECLVIGDLKSLKQVLINLLSNAIKYNRYDGKVEIIVHRERAKVRISICDTGRGLNEEQLKALFQPFERVGAESSAVEGLGIGLVISKNLVEAMKGDIGVRSEPGKGSTFWIEMEEG